MELPDELVDRGVDSCIEIVIRAAGHECRVVFDVGHHFHLEIVMDLVKDEGDRLQVAAELLEVVGTGVAVFLDRCGEFHVAARDIDLHEGTAPCA